MNTNTKLFVAAVAVLITLLLGWTLLDRDVPATAHTSVARETATEEAERKVREHRLEGRVRRCQGTSVIAGGLSGLVGLGETCLIESIRHNSDEYDGQSPEPVLAELRSHLTLFEAGEPLRE